MAMLNNQMVTTVVFHPTKCIFVGLWGPEASNRSVILWSIQVCGRGCEDSDLLTLPNLRQFQLDNDH